MNRSLRFPRHATHVGAHPAARPTPDFPQPGEVLMEVGLILAAHLALALAVTWALRAFGVG
jgi:hypothetical protein